MLLYLVSVALVAAVITGSFFGIGFSLLQPTASIVITDFNQTPRVDANTPEADREAVLASRETGLPHTVAVDLPSGGSLGQHPTADRAASPQQSKEMRGFPPGPSNGELPAETARASEPASSSATPPVFPAVLANPPSFAAQDPGAPVDPKARPARDGHRAHTRTASQHSLPRSVHNVPTLTPPKSPFAKTLFPLRPSSFSQTKPVRQALTPPMTE
jgi:hypothetical protein